MAEKVVVLAERKGHKQTAPFVSYDGNPENGDYGAWARYVMGKEGEVVSLKPKTPKEI
ncbi:MAG: hypothetical protein JWL87_252 [Candidatus Adlerbacteria bacterium]|nr:hypothetical protein [Candidatus Adlerbacteria bacterium]